MIEFAQIIITIGAGLGNFDHVHEFVVVAVQVDDSHFQIPRLWFFPSGAVPRFDIYSIHPDSVYTIRNCNYLEENSKSFVTECKRVSEAGRWPPAWVGHHQLPGATIRNDTRCNPYRVQPASIRKLSSLGGVRQPRPPYPYPPSP